MHTQPPREPTPDSSTPPNSPSPVPSVQVHPVSDINTLTVDPGSFPGQFTKLGERLLFLARTPSTGQELWSWQAQQGAQLVLDLAPGQETALYYSAFNRLGDFVYFAARRSSQLGQPPQLWRTDGTAAGTHVLPGPLPAGEDLSYSAYAHLADVPGRLLLLRDSGTMLELWSSDGTPQGSRPLWRVPRGRSLPQRVVELDGALFFISAATCASDERLPCDTPPELWRVDDSGQALLWRAPAGGTLDNLTVWKGSLLFSQQAPQGETSLWKTDQTGSAPVEFMRLEPGARPRRLTATPGPLFFQARRQSNYGVWVTDGTAAGTVWLHDVKQLLPESRWDVIEPDEMTVVGTTDYFLAPGSSQDLTELWRTDGTPEGTRRVQEGLVHPRRLFAYQGRLYFITLPEPSSSSCLWMRTDGTPEGTEEVRRFQIHPFSDWNPSGFTVLDGELFFAADGGQGVEPWSSRGTASDTRLLLNLVPPGGASSGPHRMTVVRDTLYFTADDGIRGQELWSTDGSAAGTRLVHEFTPGPASTSFGYMLAFGSKLAVTSQEYSDVASLWLTDGSSEGTRLVRENIRGKGQTACMYGLSPYDCGGDVVVAGDTLYVSDPEFDFSPETQYHYSLFSMREGQPLRFLRTWEQQSPVLFSSSHSSLYFVAPPPAGSTAGGNGLWRTEGTAEATRMQLPLPERMQDVIWLDSVLYFTSLEPGGPMDPRGFVLWKADESAGEARRIATEQGTLNVQAGSMVVAGHRLFFMSSPGVSARSLWVSDGTDAGTHRVKDLSAYGMDATKPLMPVGDSVLFWAEEPERGWGLWRSDGTEAGTVLLQTLFPDQLYYTQSPSFASWPDGRHVVFAASDGISGMELWVSDGTSAGTALFADIAPGPASSNPETFILMGDTVYFTADDQRLGRELWAASPSGTPPQKSP